MYPLVPPVFKAIIKSTIKVSILCEVVFLVILISMGIAGIFADAFTAIFFSFVFLSIIPLAAIPCMRHYKTSQSSVVVTDECIRVVDRTGDCWREIPYDTINRIGVETIPGFFYGQDRHRAMHAYICVYLNSCTKVPDVTYAEHFMHKDFFMVYYQEDLMNVLSPKYTQHRSG